MSMAKYGEVVGKDKWVCVILTRRVKLDWGYFVLDA